MLFEQQRLVAVGAAAPMALTPQCVWKTHTHTAIGFSSCADCNAQMPSPPSFAAAAAVALAVAAAVDKFKKNKLQSKC